MDSKILPTKAAEALGLVGEPGNDTRHYLAAMNSGEAWNSFCDAIKQIGTNMLASEFAGNDLERAEGYRYLMGFLAARLNKVLYACGPDLPSFVRGMDDIIKVGLDNPDGINTKSAQIRDRYTYRLFGKAGQERYVEFVQSGAKGTLANHYLDQFEIGPAGQFEIFLSTEPHPGNWIPLQPGATGLLVRQIQYDWENETLTDIQIERPGVTGVPQCLRIPDPAEVGAQLFFMSKTLVSELDFWMDYTRHFLAEGDNVFPENQQLAMSGHSAFRSAPKGFFSIAPEEALLLEFKPPEGSFWSVGVGDVWFRTIDPSHRHTSLNGFQAKVDSDGICRVVIAHRDPGIANWLDTAGHARGVMIFRFVRTETRPRPSVRVIRHADIAKHLPADTVRVTPDERAEIIAARARGFSRRYADPFTSRWNRR